MSELEQQLIGHGVKPTSNRLLVARALLRAKRPMTMAELEEDIDSVDKSGISRTLALFRDARLVHSIEGAAEGVRYELCHSDNDEHDDDQHAHFYCTNCHQTLCLDDLELPKPTLPKGYQQHAVNLLIKGLCPKCAAECQRG